VPQWLGSIGQTAIIVPAVPEKRNHESVVKNGDALSHNEMDILKKEA
jgi:hypothetical protein